MGSAALTLCYVAMGAVEGYHSDNLMPWDVAAGVLIVKEAGGVIIDTNGIILYILPIISLILIKVIYSYFRTKNLFCLYHFLFQSGGDFNVMSPKLLAVGNCKLANELVKLIKHADFKTHQRMLLLQAAK